jgi:hypothetical protein
VRKNTLEEIQLTISKTRFGSKSKWPINDCRSKLNQNYDHYYYKTKTENHEKDIILQTIKTLIMPIVDADPF